MNITQTKQLFNPLSSKYAKFQNDALIPPPLKFQKKALKEGLIIYSIPFFLIFKYDSFYLTTKSMLLRSLSSDEQP